MAKIIFRRAILRKKTDLRVIRTQKSIKEVFLKLLKAKKYEQISIQDIATEAIINENAYEKRGDYYEKII